jgi:ribonuclease HII
VNEPPTALLERTAGVDEAGRGPLAGPVVAAAVILHPEREIPGLADSKALTALRRAKLDREIRERALAWGVGVAGVDEIDRFNILRASLLAMRRAVEAMGVVPDLCLVDGNQLITGLACPQRAVVHGDALVSCISAASILAKVWRDTWMREQDELHPGYGFAKHKGYYCDSHVEALRRLGPCPIHRRSFSPVREMLLQGVLIE